MSNIGQLFTLGLTLDLKKLYPPIEYPVGTGTPMLSPGIKWDHSKEWVVPSWEEFLPHRSVFIKAIKRCPVVETSNSFAGLSVEDIVQEVVEESKEGDSGISGGLWEGERAKGKVLFVGDSIVRVTDREFCKRDRRNRVRIRIPGARIEDISAKFGKKFGGRGGCSRAGGH
ncbi:Fatty acid synthase [Holothuria leucospilota]|uniref:Fatty acid synthase n=1 Tax=Holothuria leucospilota TaxID=206669 RepID=A0A9Q1H1J7_HOLLE|nr:Fatty acid synthase [Holothuria leucospilota]